MPDHSRHPRPPSDAEAWDERYRSAPQVWSGEPNPQLVAETSRLAAGRALDAGCGEGADALWLADRGWEVVAVDISGVALERAAAHAEEANPTAAGRIEWRRADLVAEPPTPDSFDLVSAQFLQLSPEPRAALFQGLIAAVRAGGTLLIVGHDPSDLETGVRRPPVPERFYTAADVAGLLGAGWSVEVSEARPRPGTRPDGETVTVRDAVLRATRR
jgi:SAM-dependent methyltransferase